MNLTLKYFGLLVDITQKKEEVLHLDQNKVVLSDVKSAIESLYEELKNASYTIAVNQLLCNLDSTINDRDVIALLPPFAGG